MSYERSRRKLERSSPAVLFVLGAMPMLLAVIYTFSRGGTVLLAAYFLLALGVFVLHRLLSRQGTTTHPLVTLSVTLMMLLALGYAVSLLDFRRVEQRFDQLLKPEIKDVSYTARLEAHLASTAMLGEHWRRGVGAGGFRFLYPEYIKQHPAIYQGGRLFWEHAHNDWLQIPIELGAAGGLLLLAGAAYWLCALFRHRVWRDLPAVLLCLGLAQTLVHATFDFPLQNPAILTTWCALAVLALRHVELDEAR
ncbi:MAG: O-antigen ligase family protein [Opitutae bacterium]|nr:O-antigen ligase family protein [Opitutae bacterium]